MLVALLWANQPTHGDEIPLTHLVSPGLVLTDIGPSITCSTSGIPCINESGQVLVAATFTGSGVTSGINDRALYLGRPGSLARIIRIGETAPGLPSGIVLTNLTTFGSAFQRIGLDDTGLIIFSSGLAGPGVSTTNDIAFFAGTPGNIALIAREGDAAPGLPGVTMQSLLGGLYGNAGKVSFFASLAGTGVTPANDFCMWAGPPGNPTEFMMREGSPIIGFESAIAGSFGIGVSRDGTCYSTAILTGAGVTTDNDDIFFIKRGATFATWLREGDPAPTFPPDVLNSTFPRIVVANDVALVRIGLRGNVTTTNDDCVIIGHPGSWRRVFREGDQAPGLPVGVMLSSLEATIPPTLNDSGDTAFLVRLTGTGVTTANDKAVYVWRNGVLSLIIRKGDALPSLGTNVFFLSPLNGIVINSSGQIAMKAVLNGSGVSGATNACVLGEDSTKQLIAFARHGSALPLGVGTIGTLTSLNANGTFGIACQFSGDGELAVQSTLSPTGSISFLADLRANPVRRAWTIPQAFEANTGAGVDGIEITPTADVDVVALGYYDDIFAGADGLAASHLVGIYDAQSQQLVASATVPAGSLAPKDTTFRFVDITPARLTSGHPYVLAGVSNDDWGHNVAASDLSASSLIQFGNWRIGGAGPQLSFPASVINSAARFMGPNMKIRRHEEPPSCPADLDGDGAPPGAPDGAVTIDDLLFYLLVFELGDGAADLDDDGSDPASPDGGVTVDDLIFFLTHFEAGC